MSSMLTFFYVYALEVLPQMQNRAAACARDLNIGGAGQVYLRIKIEVSLHLRRRCSAVGGVTAWQPRGDLFFFL